MKSLFYWGKTDVESGYHRFLCHTLDVAACGIRLLERSDRLYRTLERHLHLSRQELVRLIAWASVLHDLGKLSPSFQRQDEATSKVADILGVGPAKHEYNIRHDSLGWTLWEQICPRGSSLGGENVRILMRCATGHHGKPPSKTEHGVIVNPDRYFGLADIEAALELVDWANKHFYPVFPEKEAMKRASWWIAGIITLADWLGSNKDFFPYEQGEVDPVAYLEKALLAADRVIEATGVVMPGEKREFHELFKDYKPTPVQQCVLNLPIVPERPFFMVIEETTGGGKTEAALSAARGASLFFGLPTMATANGLWHRIKKLDGQQSLVHGKRWLIPAAMDRATAWLNDSNRKSLLADVGVGTIDQAMIGVMYARYSTLRLAGLAGKTLIIDEVHAYDTYMKHIISTLITMQARSGGSVILLSATLPLAHRADYASAWRKGSDVESNPLEKTGFPLVTFIDHQGTVTEQDGLTSHYDQKGGRNVSVESTHITDAVIKRIQTESSKGRCVAWVRNTIDEAIAAYESLLALGVDVMLFHSRFVAGDRKDIENLVLETFGKSSTENLRAGKVLVATQVIEQSLDLDFDFMVTDLCPVDLLIQRAGRLHRHDRGVRGNPTLLIHAPVMEESPGPNWIGDWSKGTAFVYENHAVLWNTLRIIGNGFSLPNDARRLIEGVYTDGAVPAGLQSQSREIFGRELARISSGNDASVNPDAAYQSEGMPVWDDETAPTRLADRVIEWVLCEGEMPITGLIETSTVQIQMRKVTSAPESSVEVGKFQRTMRLTNGRAKCSGPQGAVLVTYDKNRGLAY
jgi:CRISPR-associated endonuclease/helicase Cas3